MMYVITYIIGSRPNGEGHTMTVTATAARQDFFHLVRKSVKGHVPVRITSKEGDAVLMSEEDYESLVETIELLKTRGLKRSLQRAERDIKAGRVYTIDQVFGK